MQAICPNCGALNDLVADRKSGVYFTTGPGPGGGAFYISPHSVETPVGENLRTCVPTMSA